MPEGGFRKKYWKYHQRCIIPPAAPARMKTVRRQRRTNHCNRDDGRNCRKIRWGEYSHLSGRSVLRKGHAPQIIMPSLSKTARPQISTVLSPASAEQAVFLFLQRYLTSLRPNPSGRRSRQLKIHNPVTVPARFRYNFLSH